MLWYITILLLYLFLYSTTGIPLNDEPKRKLILRLIPSQWGKDSEISHHWPKGEVPFVFDDKSYDDGVKARVRIAMAALERDSCIRFKEQNAEGGDGTWLHFTNPDMQRQCFHEPNYGADGEIQVVLGYDCLRQRDIMHSLLHGVGFRDEISHPQRDLFVKIMWGNIQSAYKSMFRIQPVENAGGLVEYDPMSIMHFHDRAYSLNGQATITPLLPGLRIAPSDKLSHLDKMKLRIMFGHECNKRKVGEVLNKCKGILTQYDEAELTTTKPEDDYPPNIEDVKDDPTGNNDEVPSENNNDETLITPNEDRDEEMAKNEGQEELADPNASGNNDGDEEMAKNGAEEAIVVGNNSGGKNNGDQNENVNGLQETIIVGNNDNTVVDPNVSGNNDGGGEITKNGEEEAIIVGNNDNTIETFNVGPGEQQIITEDGTGNLKENPINSDNKDAKQSNEAIIVGNDKTSNSTGPEDLKGNIVYNSHVVQDVD